MKDRLFRWVVEHPLWTTLLSLLFVVASGYGAQFLGFNDSYKAFFGEDNPNLIAYEKVQAIFMQGSYF